MKESGSFFAGDSPDEAAWRSLVEKGLKGAQWRRLVARTADGIAIQPLYRETDFATADDVSGFPGAAPFVRGARAGGPWLIRQRYDHPDPERANRDILADLAGGVNAIELAIDPDGRNGICIRDAADLDLVLADVILEAAPVSLDAGAHHQWAAELLAAKLKGARGDGVSFNLDPIGAAMRTGSSWQDDLYFAAHFTAMTREQIPNARFMRFDARPVHEAGGTPAQEIAAALLGGITYMRAFLEKALSVDAAAACLSFAFSVDSDVLLEAAKLRALRLCWARVLEAFGAAPENRSAYIHAFTSRRMMTRVDAWTNILRVTSAAVAAAFGGADAITTLPFTDALGLPTPFARRVARNTQHVLLEEAHLAQVADPAGGAWFVEKITRELAEAAWVKMQAIEAQGGILAALSSGSLQRDVADARAARERAFATRTETITGVTDFPLLGETRPDVESTDRRRLAGHAAAGEDAGGPYFAPIRWSAPFEALRESAEARNARVFFANLGALAEFGPRANFARNLFAVGGVDAIGPEDTYESMESLVAAFRRSGAKVAIITGSDGGYAEHAEKVARALKAAGATWVVLSGQPHALETKLRAAGVDQFVFAGQDSLADLEALHAALGISP